jgi:colicin import membrane protein
MPAFLQEHLRPLAGSAGLHLALLALLAGAALRWTSSQPPVELAIEGYVVDGPVKVKPLPTPRSEPAASVPQAEESVPAPAPEPVPDPAEKRRAEAAAAERAAAVAREQHVAEERAAQEREAQLAREQALVEERRAEEADRKRETEAAEAKRRAAEATRKAEEKARASREAQAQSEREADLQRRLAAEEEAEAAALARSGVMDEYRALLVQTVERNWIRPPSARAGLECTLYVTQAPGGTVVDVKLGACNGDQAVRESIANAVFRASPLPAPRDPRAFERRLEIVFKPTE